MTFISSKIEPGQPCVMSSGMAPGCRDLIWANWMSRPSIRVTNCGRAFSFASALRQS